MASGQERLLQAARSLLAAHPDREPSTRELYEMAEVTAPTLYHHFGTKAGLLHAVVGQAFEAYLERKREVPRTGDLSADFSAGWRMHVEFGVSNPVLYLLMYGPNGGEASDAAQTAEAELRRGLLAMEDAGLLQVSVDDALTLTTAMAIGCVTQLIRSARGADDPLVERMCHSLVSQIAGPSSEPGTVRESFRILLARLATTRGVFTPAEDALLRQWLRTLTDAADLLEERPATRPPFTQEEA